MEDYCEKVSVQGSDWPSVNVLLVWPPSCSRGKGGDAIKRTPFLFRGRGCAFQDTHTRTRTWALMKTFLQMNTKTLMRTT